ARTGFLSKSVNCPPDTHLAGVARSMTGGHGRSVAPGQRAAVVRSLIKLYGPAPKVSASLFGAQHCAGAHWLARGNCAGGDGTITSDNIQLSEPTRWQFGTL